MVIPALAGLLVVYLILGGRRGIKGGHVIRFHVLLDSGAIRGIKVEVHIGNGIFVTVYLYGGEAALEDAGVPQDHGGSNNHYHDTDQSIQGRGTAVGLFLLTALLLALSLGLALILFGFAHSLFSPLI